MTLCFCVSAGSTTSRVASLEQQTVAPRTAPHRTTTAKASLSLFIFLIRKKRIFILRRNKYTYKTGQKYEAKGTKYRGEPKD
jgi:hypothetical protein